MGAGIAISVTCAYAIFGEIDFAIVEPTGKILLIGQKAGVLSETPGGLTKKYLEKEKNVPSQMGERALGHQLPQPEGSIREQARSHNRIHARANSLPQPEVEILTYAGTIPISDRSSWGKDYADPYTFFAELFDGGAIIKEGNTNYSLVGITPAMAKTVGATRSTMKLTLVVSGTSAKVLLDRLSGFAPS